MARILTRKTSYVHEQYHLIHFRHLQIYCRSPPTSAKNLDIGLQAAVPSYDARYFVYERMAKQGIIHSHEIRLKAKIYNWGTTWGYWCHIVWLTYTNIFLWFCQINANINDLVVCLNTLVYLICLLCDYVGTNPIHRIYMEISFNYLVYFGGHIWINGNVMVNLHQ